MTNEERIEILEEVIDTVEELYSTVKKVVRGTAEGSRLESYGGYGFAMLLNKGNPHDRGLRDLVEAFESEDGEDD